MTPEKIVKLAKAYRTKFNTNNAITIAQALDEKVCRSGPRQT